MSRGMPTEVHSNGGPRLTILTSRAANLGLPANYDETQSSRIMFASLSALPQLKNNAEATASSGVWSITLRPVRATKQSCVGCHHGSKQGATLGVLMYAVN